MGTIEEGGGHRICFYTDPPHRTGLWKFPKERKGKILEWLLQKSLFSLFREQICSRCTWLSFGWLLVTMPKIPYKTYNLRSDPRSNPWSDPRSDLRSIPDPIQDSINTDTYRLFHRQPRFILDFVLNVLKFVLKKNHHFQPTIMHKSCLHAGDILFRLAPRYTSRGGAKSAECTITQRQNEYGNLF